MDAETHALLNNICILLLQVQNVDPKSPREIASLKKSAKYQYDIICEKMLAARSSSGSDVSPSS